MLHCYTATFGIFNEKVMEMNKEMYLTEHLVLPSEATLSQTSELDGVRKLSIHLRRGFCLDHLRRGLALGSGPDEKVASDFTSVPDPIERRLRQCQTPARGKSTELKKN